jgi:hypothetical protein
LPSDALEDALKGLEPDDITGPDGMLTQLAGRVIETALGAELTEHLGHPPGGTAQGRNVRNGAGRKTIKPIWGRLTFARRATVTAASNRGSWASVRPGWPAWTTRSWASTPAG